MVTRGVFRGKRRGVYWLWVEPLSGHLRRRCGLVRRRPQSATGAPSDSIDSAGADTTGTSIALNARRPRVGESNRIAVTWQGARRPHVVHGAVRARAAGPASRRSTPPSADNSAAARARSRLIGWTSRAATRVWCGCGVSEPQCVDRQRADRCSTCCSLALVSPRRRPSLARFLGHSVALSADGNTAGGGEQRERSAEPARPMGGPRIFQRERGMVAGSRRRALERFRHRSQPVAASR